jgi:hypothetical protein
MLHRKNTPHASSYGGLSWKRNNEKNVQKEPVQKNTQRHTTSQKKFLRMGDKSWMKSGSNDKHAVSGYGKVTEG